MGSVYLAEHLVLRRRVALKTVAPEFFGDSEMRERFLQECRMVATIDHRNVIPVFDAAEENGLVFVAMRYVEGTDLTGLITQRGSLEPDEALSIVDQVGSALDAVHQRAIVHRDVKPANILIEGADGRVFLADFGVATQSGATKPRGEAVIVGTIDYCAPEQLEGNEVGPAADVYALGCVLFQSLTGHRPFERDTDVAVFHAQLLAPPPLLLSLRPGLPGPRRRHHEGARQGARGEIRKLPSARRRRESRDRRPPRACGRRRGTGSRARRCTTSCPPDIAARPPG